MIPQAGSAYAYSYATLGELVAWIIGWDLILEYAVGNVAVAISWGDYFTTLLRGRRHHLPAWLTTGYRTALLSSNPAVHGLLQTAPHVAGIPILRERAGVRHRDAHHLAAAARRAGERAREQHHGGRSSCWRWRCSSSSASRTSTRPTTCRSRRTASRGIHQGAAIVFFAYIGFDAISTAAEETDEPAAQPADRHPRRAGDLHGHLRDRRASCSPGMVPYQAAGGRPIRWRMRCRLPGFTTVGLDRGARRRGVDDGGAAGLPVRPAAHLLRDGARRPAAAVGGEAAPDARASRTATTLLTGIVVACAALVGDAAETYDLTNIGTLFAFALVCIGVLVLRVHGAGPAAAVPGAVRLGGGAARRRGVRVHHGGAAVPGVGAVRHLARHRAGALLRRTATGTAGCTCGERRRRRGSRRPTMQPRWRSGASSAGGVLVQSLV